MSTEEIPKVVDVYIPGHRVEMTYDEWLERASTLLLDPGHILVSRPWFAKFAAINNRRYDVSKAAVEVLEKILVLQHRLPEQLANEIKNVIELSKRKIDGEI